MTEAVCFRCDWQGRARGATCPSCGAPAYRPPRTGSPSDATEDDEARVGEDPRDRTAPRGAAIAVAAVLALVAVASIELVFGEAPAARPASTRERGGSGALVYLAQDRGRSTLWVVDLVGGGARPGPEVPRGTDELVDVSGASSGWVGLERRAGHREVAVSVVRGVATDADVHGLGRGDLVAWGPGGSTLVFARNGRSARAGCVPVRISLVSVITEAVGWALDDPGFCGPVLSLSRSAAATYFTAASGDRLSVYLTGTVGVPHLMFDGLGMISASPPSAFLLAPGTARRDPSSGAGTLLGWKGIGGPVVVGRGEDVLAIDRILAWSGDGRRVALVGALGARRGVFVVDAGSGSAIRVPRYVTSVGLGLDATFDVRGRLYVVRNGEVFVAGDGPLRRLRLPAGAPSPSGPVVWIP
jgi:hypothetical protein